MTYGVGEHEMRSPLATGLFIGLVFVLNTASLLSGNESLMYLSLLLLGITALILQKFIHGKPIKDLGFKWPKVHGIIYAIVFPLSAILFIAGVDFLMGWIKGQSPEAICSSINFPLKGSLPLMILYFVLIQWILTTLINLITEELIFRGYLLNQFRNLGVWKAVLFSSLLFGLWHIPVAILIIKGGVVEGEPVCG
jgi:uncharacterized protein